MLTTINNYRVKRLLLNGHYVCSSSEDSQSLHLLCTTKNKIKRSLRNYKLLYFENILFPSEITVMTEGETYDCFRLPENYSLCMTKLQTKSYSSTHLVVMFLGFCKIIPQIIEHDVLKKQILTCLCWDNMWTNEQELILVWYPEKKQTNVYSEEVLIEKLVQILKMMHLTTYSKQKDNNLLKSIVGFLKSSQNEPRSLKQFIAYLQELVPMKFVPHLQRNRYSPVKMSKIEMSNRYSIDHAESSLEKSLRFIKSNRKKTIDITDLKRKSKLGKISLFQSFKKNTSPSNHNYNSRSKDRSFSKDLTNHMRDYSESDTIRTESGNLRISNLLRNKAIEAFEVEKQHSIDAARLTPDKSKLILSGMKSTVTQRQSDHSWNSKQKMKFEPEERYEERHSLIQNIKNREIVNTFKMKMLRFQKKKDTDDKLMRMFNSNRHHNKASLKMDFPKRMSTLIDKIQYHNPRAIQRSEIKLPSQNFANYTSPGEQRNTIQHINCTSNQIFRPLPLPIHRNIFQNDFVKQHRSDMDVASSNSKQPSQMRQLINRLIDAPVVIRTVNSEMEFEKKERLDRFSEQQKYAEEQKYEQTYQQRQQSMQVVQIEKQPASSPNKNIKQKSVHILEKQDSIKIKNSKNVPTVINKKKNLEEEEQIEEIVLESKSKKEKPKQKQKQKQKSESGKSKKSQNKVEQKQKAGIMKNKANIKVQFKLETKQKQKQQIKQPYKNIPNTTVKANKQEEISNKHKQKTEKTDDQSRVDTMKSSTKSKRTDSQLKRVNSMNVKIEDDRKSSNTQKSNKVSAIESKIQEYIHFINLMGEAVSKSQKVCKGFVDVEWFTGIYFLYKRFFRERQKIEQWLEDGVGNFKRDAQPELDKDEFQKWLSSESRNNLLKKIKQQNVSIGQSIAKMYKNLTKKCINTRVLNAAVLTSQHVHQSNIMMEHLLVEYDELSEKQITEDIRQHLIQTLDGAFIVAELDGKKLAYLVDLKGRRGMKDTQVYFGAQQIYVDDLGKAYNIQ